MEYKRGASELYAGPMLVGQYTGHHDFERFSRSTTRFGWSFFVVDFWVCEPR